MNNKLKTVSVNPIIVKNYMGMIFESMIKGENVTAEPIDNSVNVGSLNVHYKIKDNQIITADNGNDDVIPFPQQIRSGLYFLLYVIYPYNVPIL